MRNKKVITNQENLPGVIELKHPVFEAFKEIVQARTQFQLDKFVIGQHDTDEQRYKQIVLEIKGLVDNLRKLYLIHEKNLIQYERLCADKDPLKQIDAKIMKIDLDNFDLDILGSQKELAYLIQVWENWEHKYTAEEIENGQPNYWNARLNRQASLESIGTGGIVNWASLESLLQIGALPSLDPAYYLEKNREAQEQQKEELK